MSDLLTEVQNQHANYSKMLEDKQKYLQQTVSAIKQLKAERKTAVSHITELTGAINMAKQVIEKLQATQTCSTDCEKVVDATVVEEA